MPRLIVIGGVAAGMSAAAEAKRSNSSLDVTVYERGPYISYGACGLPYFLSNTSQKPNDLVAVTPEEAKVKKGVDVRVNHEVNSLDTVNKVIAVTDTATGRTFTDNYDSLVIATGAESFVPRIQGADSELLFKLRTLTDGVKLKTFIADRKPVSAVVIGDGHIALEISENLILTGIKNITLIARNRHLCWWLDSEIADIIADEARGRGISLVYGEKINEITGNESHIRVITEKTDYIADLGVISCGMKPNTKLAQEAGIALDAKGAVMVDEHMRTSAEGVFAAGDCCNVYFIPDKKNIYMPRGTTANRQGRVAGYNAAGVNSVFKGTAGAMVFKFFGLEIGRTGLSDEMASVRKINYVSCVIKSRNRAGYYPGSERIHVKLTADRDTGKIIGGQIAGAQGSAKRIDVISLAIMQGLTADEFKSTDMAYAPPFSPVWDPVLIAANKLAKLL